MQSRSNIISWHTFKMDTLQNYYGQFAVLDWKVKVAVVAGLFIVLYFVYNTLFGRADVPNDAEQFKSEGTLTCTMYYTTWCPACKKAKPEWSKVQQALDGQTINGNKISILKVDCDEDPQAAEAAGIKGYPTFHLNLNGQHFEYDDERTFDKMKDYITSIAYSTSQ